MKIKLKKLYRRYADFQSPKSLSSFYTKIFYICIVKTSAKKYLLFYLLNKHKNLLWKQESRFSHISHQHWKQDFYLIFINATDENDEVLIALFLSQKITKKKTKRKNILAAFSFFFFLCVNFVSIRLMEFPFGTKCQRKVVLQNKFMEI